MRLVGVLDESRFSRRKPISPEGGSLSDEQLLAIERARGEGEVRLRLHLQSTLLAPPPNVFPVRRNRRQSPSRWLDGNNYSTRHKWRSVSLFASGAR
jgi:hypothetical protein